MPWASSDEGLALAALTVSAQRFARPVNGAIASIPSSRGLLPMVPDTGGAGRFVLPVADDEAIWLGLLGDTTGLSVCAIASDGTDRPLALRPQEVDLAIILGLAEGSKTRTIDRSHITTLVLTTPAETATVELISPSVFKERTGAEPPPPIEEAKGYRGTLLP